MQKKMFGMTRHSGTCLWRQENDFLPLPTFCGVQPFPVGLPWYLRTLPPKHKSQIAATHLKFTLESPISKTKKRKIYRCFLGRGGLAAVSTESFPGHCDPTGWWLAFEPPPAGTGLTFGTGLIIPIDWISPVK